MAEPKVLVIIHQPSGIIWTGKASTNEEAERELGFSVRDCPVYDVDNDEDVRTILAFMRSHSS